MKKKTAQKIASKTKTKKEGKHNPVFIPNWALARIMDEHDSTYAQISNVEKCKQLLCKF